MAVLPVHLHYHHCCDNTDTKGKGAISAALLWDHTSGPIHALRPLSGSTLIYSAFVLSILRMCADLRESYQIVFRPVSCRSRSITILCSRFFLSQPVAF
jgi:hypothetical protein